MSIFIKGMKMPTCCAGCCLDRFCKHWDIVPYRHEDCPLVPVPPHGRLIDADAQNVQIEALIERLLHGYTRSTWDFVCQLRDILKHARTIIPADSAEEDET